jgi:hypothetical protein
MNENSMSKPTFTIVLTDAGGSGPAIVRLRRLLKLMLRGFGLRCVRLTDATGGDVGQTVEVETDTPLQHATTAGGR